MMKFKQRRTEAASEQPGRQGLRKPVDGGKRKEFVDSHNREIWGNLEAIIDDRLATSVKASLSKL